MNDDEKDEVWNAAAEKVVLVIREILQDVRLLC